jgi:hypothetical protein
MNPMTTSENPLLAIITSFAAPHKKDFLLEAATMIASEFPAEEPEDIMTVIIELYEQLINDISKVLENPLAITCAEKSFTDKWDYYLQAEKIGKRITYGVYLRAVEPDENDEIELVRIKKWVEYLKDYD